MQLARFATTHVRAILFVTVALCVVGAWTLPTFPVAILPEVTFPRVVVIAESGRRPVRVMEAAVARPLEEAVATVPGALRIRTKLLRGEAEMSVDFAWGTDIQVAQQLVNTRINEVRGQLPPETEVTAERMNATVFPIFGISLRAQAGAGPALSQAELWNLATYTLKPRLARVPGVARVVVQGGDVPEIAVTVSPDRLAAYRLSLADVEQALTQANVVRSVGRIDRQYQQYEALVSGEATTPEELGRIVVVQRNGAPILLSQLAAIRPGVQDRTTMVTADGAESVLVNIVRQPEANTVSVAEGVRREMAAMRETLPRGVAMGVFYDQSVLVRDAVNSVRDAVLIGAILAIVVLMLFLRNIRATVVTAAIIPITVLITFLVMRLVGLTLNLMTLGALAVGIGLVIDDAIVVVENVFRHLRQQGGQGRPSRLTIEQAANEIAGPMVSSTLTTVVVFLPLVLVAEVAGAFFTALAVTLAAALMVSLALALLVSPSMCASFLRLPPSQAAESATTSPSLLAIAHERLMRFGFRNRWFTPVALAAVIGLTIFFATRLGTGFMPAMDEGAFVLDFWTPPGTSLTESDRLLRQVEAILRETPEVAAYSRRVGTELGFAITESNRGDFAVMLKPGSRRGIEPVMDELRDKIQSRVPGVDVEFIQVLQDLIGDLAGAPAPVEVRLYGEDLPSLHSAAREVADGLGKIRGAVDVNNGVIEAGPELVARIDPILAGRVGLTTDQVATQVSAAMVGDVVTQVLRGDRQTGVRVRYPASARRDRKELAQVAIRTPGGTSLPLAALARIDRVAGTSALDRDNQRRIVSVSAGLSGRDLGSVVRDVQAMMRGMSLPAGVTYVMGGQFESQGAAFRSLAVVLGLAILLVFAVMLFQFRSYTAPAVIMLLMPLSLFGVGLGLWITGTPLNVSSFMGTVMLVGIVVKNGILLLDRAQHAEAEGATVEEAVLVAGRVRMRPILMTTLTAILGLVPLALGLGSGAEMQKPLAIAVIGGLTFSTLFTLLFGPLLYVGLRRVSRMLHGSR